MRTFPSPGKLFLFAVLNLADLALTGYLLAGRGVAYESNPVAAWCLDRFGWAGLGGFKAATAVLAVLLLAVVSRRRPRVAGGVLSLGCAALLGVVGYSTLLAAREGDASPTQGLPLFEAPPEARVMERNVRVKERVAEEVAENRLTLTEAAAYFRELDSRTHRASRRLRWAYPGRTDEERYCRQVIGYVECALERRGSDSSARREALEAELQGFLRGKPLLPRGPARTSRAGSVSGRPVRSGGPVGVFLSLTDGFRGPASSAGVSGAGLWGGGECAGPAAAAACAGPVGAPGDSPCSFPAKLPQSPPDSRGRVAVRPRRRRPRGQEAPTWQASSAGPCWRRWPPSSASRRWSGSAASTTPTGGCASSSRAASTAAAR